MGTLKSWEVSSCGDDCCPNCGGDLEFEAAEVSEGQVCYPCTCDDCGFQGEQSWLMHLPEFIGEVKGVRA